MPRKDDPKHVVDLALQPIGRGPNAFHARRRLVLAHVSLDPQSLVLLKRIQNQHQVESLLALGPIHSRQIHQQTELLFVPRVDRNFQEPIDTNH